MHDLKCIGKQTAPRLASLAEVMAVPQGWYTHILTAPPKAGIKPGVAKRGRIET